MSSDASNLDEDEDDDGGWGLTKSHSDSLWDDAPPHDTVRLNDLAARIHRQNRKWWYGPDGARLHRNKGELLMLVVTEIAEAMEGERKNLMDDKLPHRRMAEVEVVDAVIRLLDYAAGFGYDLDGALREKLAYNAQREDHKREAALIARDAQFAAARAGESRNG